MRHRTTPFTTYFILLLATFFLAHCSEDNYDLTQEIEGPHEPVEAVEGVPFVNVISPAGQRQALTGKAATLPSGFSALITAPDAELDCDLRFSYSGGGTVIFFDLRDDGSSEPGLVLSTDITAGPPYYTPAQSGDCSSLPRTMTLTESGQGILSGTYQGEFFYRDYDLPDTSACSQLVSMGVYTIEFSVPHRYCP